MQSPEAWYEERVAGGLSIMCGQFNDHEECEDEECECECHKPEGPDCEADE